MDKDKLKTNIRMHKVSSCRDLRKGRQCKLKKPTIPHICRSSIKRGTPAFELKTNNENKKERFD